MTDDSREPKAASSVLDRLPVLLPSGNAWSVITGSREPGPLSFEVPASEAVN